MTTHYTVLGLPEQATLTDIKREYRRLVLLTHPDRTSDSTAHQRYLAINEAYETLSDPARRAAYDAVLARLQQPDSVPEAAFESHPDPAMRRRGFRRTRPAARRPLEPIHVRYAEEFQRVLPRFRVAAWLSLLAVLLLVLDYAAMETLPNEVIREFEYVQHHGKRGSWTYFIVYTANAHFTVSNTTELEEGDQITVRQTPMLGNVYTVSVESGKMRGHMWQVANFGYLWGLSAIVAGSALVLLALKLRPDRAFNLGFFNSFASFILVLYLFFM